MADHLAFMVSVGDRVARGMVRCKVMAMFI